MTCWHAEWRRFVAQRINLAILLLLAVALGASALWSGLAARELRQEQQRQQQARDTLVAQALAEATQTVSPSAAAALQAFNLGRSPAALAQLPPLGGLALSVSRFDVLSPTLLVSLESRHADGRRSDTLDNPLLAGLGRLDLASVAALFLPLALIALCVGVVQEDRESGVWHTVCAQTARPWRAVAMAIGLRAVVVAGLAIVLSAIGLGLDPLAGGADFAAWALYLVLYLAVWAALAAVLALLRLSAGAVVTVALGAWLMSSFAMPAWLDQAAARQAGTASRLQTIVDMRAWQQDAEMHMDRLVDDWYRRHPEHTPFAFRRHTWPVTFVPRFLAQDQQLRPAMRAFDNARARRQQWLAEHAWLSPTLALLLSADHLAGIDAARYAAFVGAADAFEDRWRDALVPQVMNYRGLAGSTAASLPRFDPATIAPATIDAPTPPGPSSPPAGLTVLARALALPAIGLALLFLLLRRRFDHP